MNPDPPVNVRLVDTAQREWPVQCVYMGKQKGIHVWEVIVPDDFPPRSLTRVRAESLPARTELRLPL